MGNKRLIRYKKKKQIDIKVSIEPIEDKIFQKEKISE